MKFRELRRALALGTAEESDFEGFDPEDVAEMKAEVGTRFRALLRAAEVVDQERRVMRFVASTEHTDRMGDIIRLRGGARGADGSINGRGWLLGAFGRAGAPFFLNHRSDQELGAWLRVWVDETYEVGGKQGALLADAEYLKAGVSPLADVQWALASGKGLASGKAKPPGTSVGFQPVEGKMYYPQTEDERKAIGLGRWGIEFLEHELLEVSATKIPANPWANVVGQPGEEERAVEAALDELVGAGAITTAAAEVYRKSVPLGPDDAARRARERRRAIVDMAAAPAKETPAADAPAAPAAAEEKAETAEEPAKNKAALDKVREAVEHMDAAMALMGECLQELEGEAGYGDEEDEAGKGLDSLAPAVFPSGRLGSMARSLASLDERLARIEAKVGAGGSAVAEATNGQDPKAVAGQSVRGRFGALRQALSERAK